MKTYHVGYDTNAKIAHVSESLGSLPTNGAVTKLGSFMLPDDTEDDLGYVRNAGNATIYHGVRDKLYTIGVQDMATVEIRQA